MPLRHSSNCFANHPEIQDMEPSFDLDKNRANETMRAGCHRPIQSSPSRCLTADQCTADARFDELAWPVAELEVCHTAAPGIAGIVFMVCRRNLVAASLDSAGSRGE